MKRRYVFDPDSGLLVDRDGEALGRVVGLTIELPVGGRGAKAFLTSTPLSEESNRVGGGVGEPHRPTASQLEREAIERVWRYCLEVIPSKRSLDDKRRRVIRNALRLVGEEAVMRAVLGLSRSPFHGGQNEQRKTYLEIRYALKGIGDESDDERIEKAISWAAMYAPDAAPVDPDKVQRWLEEVRYTLSLPHRPERQRAAEAYRKLQAAGFTVVRLSGPPWARLER